MLKRIVKYTLVGLLVLYAFALAVYATHFPDRLHYSKEYLSEFGAVVVEVPVLAFEALFGATDNADSNATEIAVSDLDTHELARYRYSRENGVLNCVGTLTLANSFMEGCAADSGNPPSAAPAIHRIQVYFWTSTQLCLLQKSQLVGGYRNLRCYRVVN